MIEHIHILNLKKRDDGYMIDFHCHILPNLDDGPKTMDESILMCKYAYCQGIRSIIATPHFLLKDNKNNKEQVLKSVKDLQVNLDEHNIKIQIYPAQEIRLIPSLLEEIERDNIIFLGNSDRKEILIELSNISISYYSFELLDALIKLGICPIIAHPERNRAIQKNLEILEKIICLGCKTQITAGSFAGYYGSLSQRVSIEILKRKMIDYIGSDAHNISKRNFYMLQSKKFISNIDGNVWRYCQNNVSKLLKYKYREEDSTYIIH